MRCDNVCRCMLGGVPAASSLYPLVHTVCGHCAASWVSQFITMLLALVPLPLVLLLPTRLPLVLRFMATHCFVLHIPSCLTELHLPTLYTQNAGTKMGSTGIKASNHNLTRSVATAVIICRFRQSRRCNRVEPCWRHYD